MFFYNRNKFFIAIILIISIPYRFIFIPTNTLNTKVSLREQACYNFSFTNVIYPTYF